LLSESSNWIDVLEVLESGMTGLGRGGLRQGLLHVLELYGHRESVGRLTTLPVTIKSSLGVSSDGDDTMQLWHL
jgi:hypothetical protein